MKGGRHKSAGCKRSYVDVGDSAFDCFCGICKTLKRSKNNKYNSFGGSHSDNCPNVKWEVE